jgi:hypothetical protein
LKNVLTVCLVIWLTSISVCLAEEKKAEEKKVEKLETGIDYAEVNDLLLIVSDRSRSRYVFAEVALELKNPELAMSDIKMALRRKDELIQHIDVEKNGSVILPVIPLDQMAGVTLYINQVKNDAALSINFGIKPPSENTIKYLELFIVLQDINEFTGEIAGIASWFIRDKVALKFKFDDSATVEIRGEKKTVNYETDDNQVIVIKVKKGFLKENPDIVFSQLPIGVGV